MKTKIAKIDETWTLCLRTEIIGKKIISNFSHDFILEIGVGIDDAVILRKDIMKISGDLKGIKKKDYKENQELFHNSLLELYNQNKSDLKAQIERISKL